MSFASGFYSFNIDLSDTSRGVYHNFRIKIARHPEESLSYLYARVIALCHSYSPELLLTAGVFEKKLPTATRKSVIGEVLTWLQVGCPSQDKIQRALRSEPTADFCVYFTCPDEIEQFCHYLRGSKSNWVSKIRFYEITPAFLEDLTRIEHSSINWTVTIIDNHLYLVFDGREFNTVINEVDIWRNFQLSLHPNHS